MKKLFLDDKREPWDNSWDVVRSYNEFVAYIEEYGLPDVISFDHDLHEEHYHNDMYKGCEVYNKLYKTFKHKTGYHCAQWLCEYCIENDLKFPIVNVHSWNPAGAMNIAVILSNYSMFYNEEDIGNIRRPFNPNDPGEGLRYL